jgi:transcriptional regulator with XRE-family HTH domain
MKTQRDRYAELFADYMIEAMERTGLRQKDIVKSTRLSRTTISNLVGKKPSSATGKLMLPERETVDAIARAFGDPPALARRAAGYSESDQVETVEQALDATLYWDTKGLGEEEKQALRPILEMLDREAERLANLPKRKGLKKVVDIRDLDPDVLKSDRRH